MNFLIYLDQNTLSELRQRKIEETGNNELKLLKLVMQSEQAVLVYSYVNLEEILQIPKNTYQEEHIDLLIELQAQYIEPLTGRLNNNCPRDIWNEFLEIKKTNNEMGIESLIDFSQLFSRKISGLPVEESFDEINNKLKDSLTSVLENGENQLAAIDMTSLGEEQRAYIINIQNQMNEARELIKTLKAPSFSKEQPLGPQVFRDMPKLKSLEINNLNVGDVVNAIEEIFTQENSDFIFGQYFEKNAQTDVVRAYHLMNWAGYYADDFTKNKKGKDRFNASNKDMLHVAAALGTNFLISSDIKFRKKAMACFAYIDFKTIVCSPKEFIERYFKFF